MLPLRFFDSNPRAQPLNTSNFADRILFEDNHLLVVDKPAMLATMGASPGADSLVEQAKRYLKRKYDKPGNVYVGVVSRLDMMVTGVVVLARTSKAAARLSGQFAQGRVRKKYWALVHPGPGRSTSRLECEDWVAKCERERRMRIVDASAAGAKRARLTLRVLESRREWTRLEIDLATGRKHQIRLQLASRGWPVLGDRKYGATTRFPRGIALHSRELEFEHPVRRTTLRVAAPLPQQWKSEA